MKDSVIKQQLDLLNHSTGIPFIYTNGGISIQSTNYTDLPILTVIKTKNAHTKDSYKETPFSDPVIYNTYVDPTSKMCIFKFEIGISLGSVYVLETGATSLALFNRNKETICRTVIILKEMFKVMEQMYEKEFSNINACLPEDPTVKIYNTLTLLKRARFTALATAGFYACKVRITNATEILNIYGMKALEGAKQELTRLLNLKMNASRAKLTTCNRVENECILVITQDATMLRTILSEIADTLSNFVQETYLIPVKIGAVYANYPTITDIDKLSNYLNRGMAHLIDTHSESLEIIDMQSSVGNKIIKEFKISEDLRYTVQSSQDDIHVLYQPKVDAITGHIIGAEGLVRWQTERRGLVPPNEFIPISERTGIIKELGKIVLDRVIEDSIRLNATLYPVINTPLRLGVNVSAIQLEDDNFVDYLVSKIEESKCNPELIDIEVTESVGMYDINHTIELLGRLSSLGITISLDDFGTGYSSLTYVKNLPLNYLKIDKSFVDTVFDTKSFCKNIIDISKKLGLITVAEGVETHEQWKILRDFQCDILQGYYFSKPVPYDVLVEKIKKSYLFE